VPETGHPTAGTPLAGVPVVDLTATVRGLYEGAEQLREAALVLTQEADRMETVASVLAGGATA
jgi:hypothetical protein